MSAELPVLEIVPQLKEQFLTSTTIILQAPPGAGKSTVLPLELRQESWLQGKKILMLEPRKLAARSVATRMASLLNEPVGKTVGYKVRFENKTTAETQIEVVTEGILTRLIQQDPELSGVGLVIFDEFHERSLHADLALALCRDLQQVLREDLRILLMSATLDGQKLAALLGNSPVLTSLGRQYPIQTIYLGNDAATPLVQRMHLAIRKALKEKEGDVLAFLPGSGEITKLQEALQESLPDLSILPLFGDLSLAQQQAAIMPDSQGKRKVILATSIAETSLTIEGVKVVVDSGLSRIPRFDSRSGLTRLETAAASLDTVDQRAGRAGRTSPGTCYRLWSEATHYQLLPHRSPEMEDADLTSLVLELAQWGIQDIQSLTWLTLPPTGAVEQARQLLRDLEALDDHYKITSRGREMLRLPTHPRLAHLLAEGVATGMAALATDIAALLEERDPLSGKLAGANLALRIEALRKWRKKEHVQADRHILERVERLAATWRKICQTETDNSMPDYEKTGRLLAAAYPERIARQRDNDPSRFRLANGKVARLPIDHDELDREKWLAVAHLDAGTTEGRIYLAAPLNPQDLAHQFKKVETIRWDSQKGTIVAQTELRLGEAIISTSPLETIPEVQRISLLCKAIKDEGIRLLPWTESATAFTHRLACARLWRPTDDWPDTSEDGLISTLEEWLGPFLSGMKRREDFKKLDLDEILKSRLSWEQQQQLDALLPNALQVPSGFLVPLTYFADGKDPVLAVRLQEMFGLLETPVINEGRTKVLLHLLSPGYKPVQVTQDLKSFWKNTYPEVRKELRVRYQKHHWPEDPWTAEAVRGVKKKIS